MGGTLARRVQGGQEGQGEANVAATRENGGEKGRNGAGRPIGRCGLLISHWQQIFATAGVRKISTTAARFFWKKPIGGATEKKANHQVNHNQPHRLVV